MFHRIKSEALKPSQKTAQGMSNTNQENHDTTVKTDRIEMSGDTGHARITRDLNHKLTSERREFKRAEFVAEAKTQTAQTVQATQKVQATYAPIRETTYSNIEQNQPVTQEKDPIMSQAENTNADNTETQINIPSSSYQRARSGITSPAGGYPGASTTSSYQPYDASAADTSAADSERRLTIGAGITMSGEIESCDYLLVEGTVEAALKGASVLEISETGVFYGTVEIEDATISGRFEGDITAKGRLTLREGASVTGTIAYKEIEIEAGAVIDGKLTPMSAVKAAAPANNVAAAEPKKEVKPAAVSVKQVNTEESRPAAANSEGGLFTKVATAE